MVDRENKYEEKSRIKKNERRKRRLKRKRRTFPGQEKRQPPAN